MRGSPTADGSRALNHRTLNTAADMVAAGTAAAEATVAAADMAADMAGPLNKVMEPDLEASRLRPLVRLLAQIPSECAYRHNALLCVLRVIVCAQTLELVFGR